MKRLTLAAAVTVGVITLPQGALAKPPWAGSDQGERYTQHERYDQHRHERHRDHRRGRSLSRSDYESLPPGLQKKVARGGALPPGWQKKLRVGRRLPGDLYASGHRAPDGFYGDIHRPRDGYTDVVIDNQVFRILDATRTIVDVFRFSR